MKDMKEPPIVMAYFILGLFCRVYLCMVMLENNAFSVYKNGTLDIMFHLLHQAAINTYFLDSVSYLVLTTVFFISINMQNIFLSPVKIHW